VSTSQPIPPSDPILDRERLQEILDLDLLSTEEDTVLQEALAEATEELDLPIGLVSVVLNDAQYFVAMQGLEGWLQEARGTPIEWSFCVNVVLRGEPFVVEDATTHDQTRDNPLVSQEGIRSYAGVPLRTAKGQVLGSLCVIGDQQRRFQPEEIRRLEGWAERVMVRIEERRRRRTATASTIPPEPPESPEDL
jgi:GAF domain-containing protein